MEPAAASAPAAAAAAPAPAPAAASAAAPNPVNLAAGASVSTSLYVGDLTGDVSEANLFDFFSRVRPVASIRVCRDSVTRRSLGYAYVNFYNSEDAQHCLNVLNTLPILENGRPCRIMWSQRNPSLRKSGVGNIFINHLDKSIDHKALYDTFCDFGNILSCKVALDEKGVSKGYAFVHYETQKMADEAIAKVNGCKIGDSDQVVTVDRFIPAPERLERSIQNFTNVYVNNVPREATYQDINALLSQYGKITRGMLKFHERSKKNFGLFNFETHEEAQRAVDALNESEFMGERIYVARAQSRTERIRSLNALYVNGPDRRGRSTNLYFKNIDDVDEAALKVEFDAVGKVVSFQVKKNDRGVSLGFGFCSYELPEDASSAISKLNGKQIGKKPLYVNYFQTSEERLRFLTDIRKKSQMVPMNQGGGVFPGGRNPMVPFQQPAFPGPFPGGYQIPFMGAPVPRQMGQNVPFRGGPAPAAAPVGTLPGGVPLTADNLRKYPLEQQFVFVSQRLYPHIMKVRPDLAPKITGMLRAWYLESRPGPEALIRLMEDRQMLDAKIAEAIQIWEEHVKQGQAQAQPQH